ncbi:phage tail fiber protein [Enterobacter roggenkampii]|uniref:phage tail fiber protein n=1 Tax=Enterobacter roggenkampii TaxID=1812935 RepID=UPI00388E7BDA
MGSITSANSTYSLVINSVYPNAQILQGYAADDAFSVDAVDKAQVVMGVDGRQSAGYIFNPIVQTITLMPDSPSLEVFSNWINAMDAIREILKCTANISLPAIGKKYTLSNGVLVNYKPIPDVKKVMQAVPFKISWERVVGENI